MIQRMPVGTRGAQKQPASPFQEGFSLLELLIALCVFLPLMIGATQLFEVGVKQQASQQSSLEVNMDATAGFNMMLMEIAQAGSHNDASTTIKGTSSGSASEHAVPVESTSGFGVGDYVDLIDQYGNVETVKLSGVGANQVTGIFLGDYVDGDTIRLFALPYKEGVIAPTALTANTDTNVTAIRFFGDIYGDGAPYYVEYVYDRANRQITRSISGSGDTQKGAAIPLITNIKDNTAQFKLHTDDQGVITSVTVSLTVENQWRNDASQLEEISLSSRVNIPSTQAASLLHYETLRYGGIDMLPPTPAFITSLRNTGVDESQTYETQ